MKLYESMPLFLADTLPTSLKVSPFVLLSITKEAVLISLAVFHCNKVPLLADFAENEVNETGSGLLTNITLLVAVGLSTHGALLLRTHHTLSPLTSAVST